MLSEKIIYSKLDDKGKPLNHVSLVLYDPHLHFYKINHRYTCFSKLQLNVAYQYEVREYKCLLQRLSYQCIRLPGMLPTGLLLSTSNLLTTLTDYSCERLTPYYVGTFISIRLFWSFMKYTFIIQL